MGFVVCAISVVTVLRYVSFYLFVFRAIFRRIFEKNHLFKMSVNCGICGEKSSPRNDDSCLQIANLLNEFRQTNVSKIN